MLHPTHKHKHTLMNPLCLQATHPNKSSRDAFHTTRAVPCTQSRAARSLSLILTTSSSLPRFAVSLTLLHRLRVETSREGAFYFNSLPRSQRAARVSSSSSLFFFSRSQLFVANFVSAKFGAALDWRSCFFCRCCVGYCCAWRASCQTARSRLTLCAVCLHLFDGLVGRQCWQWTKSVEHRFFDKWWLIGGGERSWAAYRRCSGVNENRISVFCIV